VAHQFVTKNIFQGRWWLAEWLPYFLETNYRPKPFTNQALANLRIIIAALPFLSSAGRGVQVVWGH